MGLADGSGLSFGWAGQISLKDEVERHGKKDEHEGSHLCAHRWSEWSEGEVGSKAWAVSKPFESLEEYNPITHAARESGYIFSVIQLCPALGPDMCCGVLRVGFTLWLMLSLVDIHSKVRIG